MIDHGSMNQISTLVAEPPRAPVAKPPAEEPAPSSETSEDGSGNQGTEYPEDEVQISKAARQAADPWVDRTPTEPLVDRSFPEPERGQRFDFGV